jgi:hypothetical protein
MQTDEEGQTAIKNIYQALLSSEIAHSLFGFLTCDANDVVRAVQPKAMSGAVDDGTGGRCTEVAALVAEWVTTNRGDRSKGGWRTGNLSLSGGKLSPWVEASRNSRPTKSVRAER